MLVEAKSDVGTEVEPLLVGVPGNCYPGSRLRFDVRSCVHLCKLRVRRYQFLCRFHRSWFKTPASGAGDERFFSQIPRAREFCFLPILLSHFRNLTSGTVFAYTHSPAFESVLFVPVCYQERTVSHIPGYSHPVRGHGPHPPSPYVFEKVRSMLDAFRETTGVRDSDSATELGLRLAHTAMAEAATVWAKELIDCTRNPAYPAQYFLN